MRRALKAGIGVLAVVMLMSACSSTASPGTPTTSATSGTPITIGFSAWPGWFPLQVAQEKGFFTAAGVNVKLTYFESYTDSLNALNAGKLDANAQTLQDTIASMGAGSKQVVVVVNDNSTGNDDIVAKAGIKTIADLKGKKVGVEEGTVDHFLLLQGLKQAGLTEKDIKLQPLITDAAAAAFAAGQLDAVGCFAPFTTKAHTLPGSHSLFTSKDFPGSISDHIVFRKAVVDARRADIQKIVSVWFQTIAWIKANRAEALTIMAKRAGVSVADYVAYDKGTTIFTLAQNLEAYAPGTDMKHLDFAARMDSAFLKDNGFIKTAPDLAGLLDDSFVKAVPGA
jgi:NitT/TauT family transport system substrate-binding protein